MTKLKPTEDQHKNRIIAANIERQRKLYAVPIDELATAARLKRSSMYNRLREPDRLTIRELRGMARKLHTTISGLIGEAEL